MLACDARPGAREGNSTRDGTNSSSKVCTLRCNIDPAVSKEGPSF